MPQLSLYMEDAEMEALRRDAQREGVSISRCAAARIRQHSGDNGWPSGYWENVYGSLDDPLFAVSDDDLDASLDDTGAWFE